MDLSSLASFFQYFTALFGAFLVALWLSLIFWTYRDIRSRTEDQLVQVLAALVTTAMGPFGLIVYLVLRPVETMEQAYQRTLEEEALLTEIEAAPACPGCSTRTQMDWLICPICHTQLRRTCIECGRLMELSWQICPHCGTAAPGVRSDNDIRESPD